MFTGNAHVACFYPVAKETTVFVLPAGKLLSRSKIAPSKSENGKIIYGPYENVQPFTVATTKIHTESNAPFLVATKIERTLMLSLWGSISVEENIFVVHKGAELTGPFSRLDFQLDQRGRNRPVVTEYKTLLPSTAKNIYYRDEIGNISTSSVRTQRDAVEVTIQPRFPLFGGWKTEYTIGYDVPAYQYLFSSGNSFVLKMRVMDHLFDNVVVDHLSLKIILPEGSKNFKLVTPYTMKRKPDELHFTYLDTSGRPTIVVEKDNLVDAHIQSFTLNFEFDRIQLWRKPMTAVVAFAVLFVFVVIVVRFDFTIVADPAAETRLQAQSQIEEIVDLHATRLRLFDQLTDIANKYKSNKDTSAFTTARKKAENELSQITKSVDSLKTSLKTTSADLAERLNEVQKLSKTAADHVTNYLTQVERFVRGQIQKAVFTESERMFHQKLNEAKEKMDNIVYSL
ncbi:hypothetical protein AB6A40_009784 [Gnathostoma spinigerum]|uniref:Dolichyl-diphosphooligosaccharide--protein glycosyltransferase subunit 1 n=1 Tax=Gnathostoma spinigerum TaxID=75299 RepID=A0ABD6ESX7_9BILA